MAAIAWTILSLPASATEPAEDSGAVAAAWRFDGADEPGAWEGKAPAAAAGPRAPRYPGFGEENQAAYFPGKDAFIRVKDEEGTLRFGAGESLTIETWVKLESLGNGHQVYLAGKGRHGNEGYGEQNQNYAVRLEGSPQGTLLGFLFTSEDGSGKREWHRWWSSEGFSSRGWHHVAVSYTFGQADSLRAFVDGREVAGVWDLGGATDLPPVSDADDLVIGTGYQRGAGQSLRGWLDDLVIHRRAVAPEELLARYVHIPPPPAVTPEMLSPGKVLVQVSEKGLEEGEGWPEDPQVTETWEEEAFGFFELPHKYVSTGVRADRANPSLMRAAALVELPAGKHRLLLRGRGGVRLFIDGENVMETPFPPRDTGGHGRVAAQDEYLDLGPDFRFIPPGNREKWVEFESRGGEHFVVLETVVGGKIGTNFRRPELGETVAAISPQGSESWMLLTPGGKALPYTDEGWAAFAAGRRAWLAEVNAAARAAKRAEHAAYWAMRREEAGRWLEESGEVVVPALPEGFPALNEVDHFIGATVALAAAETAAAPQGGVDYHAEVQPLLEARCYDCHQGGKAKGALRLDLRDEAFQGGEHEGPGIVPGDPDASALVFRVGSDAGPDIMPPKGDPLAESEVELLRRWIAEGASWPRFPVRSYEFTPLADDLAFLRRASFDAVGVPPSEEEVAAYLALEPERRRAEAIERLLADPRWADQWMGYWLDLLAENPNIINPTLNNTGPFRWWLEESLRDNKPLDLMVTELIRMEGSERYGGPAGFGTASQNDVPMADKGLIVGSAFLGVEMKCARCHDAPAHVSKQEDLFQLAAMLGQGPLKVPATSSVPMDRIHEQGRQPLIEVTLAPGSEVAPGWPFARFCEEEAGMALAEDPENSRDLLAALVTAPQNQRFAAVMANRVWQRLMGRGLVETLDDWERGEATHPELLSWLARELVRGGYDTKRLAGIIMRSHAYQRAADPAARSADPLYLAPAPRRLQAEQIVDGLFAATGKPFRVEEVSLDIDSVRVQSNSITLGQPRRAWMLASTSNERDRPSLSLPRIQTVASVLETFGWRGARQSPASLRDDEPNTLQPAILANGIMGTWLTRLSDDHGVTALALEDQPLDVLLDRLFLRLLTRAPDEEERARYRAALEPGYESRVILQADLPAEETQGPRVPERYVTWSNHLDTVANLLAQEKETRAREGEPPSARLEPDWRRRMEDVLWALLNSPEWLYLP